MSANFSLIEWYLAYSNPINKLDLPYGMCSLLWSIPSNDYVLVESCKSFKLVNP